MNAEIFAALAQLEKERGIPQSYMIEKITQALVAAYKKDKDGYTDNVFVEVKDDDMHMYVQKEVVDDVITPATEITLDAARKISKTAQLGDLVNVDVQTKAFGRIAAQTAKHVIRQGIREVERGQLFEEYSSRQHDIVTATVIKTDPKKGNVTLEIGKSEAILPKSEQVPGEELVEGQHVKVYVVDVRRSTRGPQILISRTHPGLVKRLFELEVPEIYDGTVEVKAISREAGARTKIAVRANTEGVNPKGALIGPGGARVRAVMENLGPEKIDIVDWSADPAKFVAAALSPAVATGVQVISEKNQTAIAFIHDDQLSLAIGKEGQNARLAARLTSWKIDIKSQSQVDEQVEAEAGEAPTVEGDAE